MRAVVLFGFWSLAFLFAGNALASWDVFEPTICGGREFSSEDARRLFPRGATKLVLGAPVPSGRIRRCTRISGCEPWKLADKIAVHDYASGDVERVMGATELSLNSTSLEPYFRLELTVAVPEVRYAIPLVVGVNGRWELNWRIPIAGGRGINNLVDHTVVFRSNCFWYKARGRSDERAGAWAESEVVMHATYY